MCIFIVWWIWNLNMFAVKKNNSVPFVYIEWRALTAGAALKKQLRNPTDEEGNVIESERKWSMPLPGYGFGAICFEC